MEMTDWPERNAGVKKGCRAGCEIGDAGVAVCHAASLCVHSVSFRCPRCDQVQYKCLTVSLPIHP